MAGSYQATLWEWAFGNVAVILPGFLHIHAWSLKNLKMLLCELIKPMAVVRNMVASTGVTNVRASVRGYC